MPEDYAVRMLQDGSGQKVRYPRKSDYQAGRFQAVGTAAAERSRINRAVGGRIV